jgi:hypothetical protein
MTGAAIALVVVVLVILAVRMAGRVKHPEQTAGHGEEPPDTTSDRFYRSRDRPAGPDAELS